VQGIFHDYPTHQTIIGFVTSTLCFCEGRKEIRDTAPLLPPSHDSTLRCLESSPQPSRKGAHSAAEATTITLKPAPIHSRLLNKVLTIPFQLHFYYFNNSIFFII
jgi:hypothetical protein